MEYNIDVKGKPMGRVASEIAIILQGKKNASYNPKDAGTDSVSVTGIKGLVLTGKKTRQKMYYKHTGPLGHLKERKFVDVFEKNPAWVLRHAVRLMLPKNKLQAVRLKRLKIVD
ncbi:MAG: large subunit ribosomal protein L13 [Parcubacteria group bacterium LiPW_41]|nr:MAG: large subunit ribosomal protein L13 [Parcubacteria group bacterium LiPW_41]